MSYNKQNFVNGQPLTAQQLNYMENGLVQLNAELDNVKTEIPKYIQTGALPDSTIGLNATVEGASNTASGDYSHAEGNYTTASEENSHAEGRNSRASGYSSHAEGSSTQATASSAHAEGSLTQATGAYAHAEGVWTTASEYASHAEGNMTTASGYASHAEGDKTTASGYASHAEGGYLYSDEEGYLEEFIIDDLNTSIISTTAEGIQSHAEGTQTLAYGYSSHSEGYRTVASGDCSHAEGYHTTASGESSHAEGNYTVASGRYSHAEGYGAKASGVYSHAEGVGTIAAGDYQHVQGMFNKEDTTSQYAFIVGNGYSLDDSLENAERSNAYALDWDGNAWFAGAINCEDKTTTLANLGAAPAVYTYSSINGIDANTIVNEYHKFVINCSNCAYPHGFLDVEKAGGEGFTPNGAVPIIQQTMREWSTGHKAYRTSVDNGATWGEWIYETPPLVHNVEYRTTERLSGQPVYVRYIHIGSIPANNEITADVGIAANKLVSLEIMTYSAAYNVAMPLPHMDSNNNSISMIGWLAGGVIHVKSFVSFTGYSAFAIIKYTK